MSRAVLIARESARGPVPSPPPLSLSPMMATTTSTTTDERRNHSIAGPRPRSQNHHPSALARSLTHHRHHRGPTPAPPRVDRSVVGRSILLHQIRFGFFLDRGPAGWPGGLRGDATPDPIPNSAVKRPSAHGTAPQGAGESAAAGPPGRTPPSPGKTTTITTTTTTQRGVEQPGSSSGS